MKKETTSWLSPPMKTDLLSFKQLLAKVSLHQGKNVLSFVVFRDPNI